ncbi:MAG: phage antirepressor Ant, partial [Lentisphaerae bacterium]|nr:phage antirepressor Ant [Lentisphaerota bacterium]MCP4102927.1 phage antirepressor Ant [Lentisphaerota bacterium]
MDTLGGVQTTTTINESGLYSLIMRSRKPNAKKFKRWVTGEVLPSIRKHGAYATPDTIENMLTGPDSMIKVLTALKQERKEKEKLIPKAAHSDSLCDSES